MVSSPVSYQINQCSFYFGETKVHYPDKSKNETVFKIFARVWIENREPEYWYTQGWIEFWPQTPIEAEGFVEARRLQLELLEQLHTFLDENYYYKVLPSSIFIEALEHSSKKLLARIYRHQDGRFEIDYLGWHPGRGGGWGMSPRSGIITFASDLESAREAASLEMEDFIAQGLVLKE